MDLYGGGPLAASVVPREGLSSSPTSATPGEWPNLLLQPPDAEEIASYFSQITPLKYCQPHQPIPSPFSPPLTGLTITAYSAGHTLGGTIWHIQHGLESIVYATDWHFTREKFLPGAAWMSSGSGGEIIEPLLRPTALVCSSRGVGSIPDEHKPATDVRNSTLISLIRETIAQGGKVLIPTDTSARVLELAYFLNSTWRENMDGPHADTYTNAKIYMASKSSSATVRYLQSMVEWMDDTVKNGVDAAITKGEGQGSASSPLNWQYVKQIEKTSQVERALARSKPCILLASDASLEWGFSRQALQNLAADSRNLVVLTEKVTQVNEEISGVGKQLWEFYDSQQGYESAQSGAKVVNSDGLSVDMRAATTESLNADENALYQQYLARQRHMHSSLQGDNTMNDSTTADIGGDQASESSESSDEDEDAEYQGRALNLSAQLTQNKRKIGALTDAELGVNVLLKGKNVHDYDVRNKRGREKMFPFIAHKVREDEFGDVIKPEEYLRAEEKDDGEAVDVKGEAESAAVGLKRKWDESTSPTAAGGKAAQGEQGKNKKVKTELMKKDREPDAIDALIAKATGEISGADGKPAEANGAVEESSDSEESEYEPEDASSPADLGPQKAVFTTQRMSLNLKISCVDYTGLYRLQDLQSIIGRINPRKLIVTAGNEQETKVVADKCREADGGKAVQGEIFTPMVGEVIDASVDTNAWTVKLSRALTKRLQWDKAPGGLDIVAVTGRLEQGAVDAAKEESTANKKLKLIKGEEAPTSSTGAEAPIPILDLLPTNYTSTAGPQQHAAQPVHVGDLRLTEIREAVQQQGHIAEMRGGGTLLVDGTVLVRKNQMSGGIEVETMSQGLSLPGWRTTDRFGRADTRGSFYAVRQAIYDRLAVVAGA